MWVKHRTGVYVRPIEVLMNYLDSDFDNHIFPILMIKLTNNFTHARTTEQYWRAYTFIYNFYCCVCFSYFTFNLKISTWDPLKVILLNSPIYHFRYIRLLYINNYMAKILLWFNFMQFPVCGHRNNECIDRTWNDVWCPTKWRESLLRHTLQVRVTSDTKEIQSSDWPK